MGYDTTELLLGIDDNHIKIDTGVTQTDDIIQLTSQKPVHIVA
ncbi:hypothetical protein [Secundilactobacillus silagei]|nr:hypothetical protein [Secundilactobacillus silagei]